MSDTLRRRNPTLRRLISIAAVTLLVLVAGIPVTAQNLLQDNPHARRAQQLRQQAETAMDEGEYELALEYAEEADRERELALEWAEQRVWAFRANSMRNRAREQIIYANRINAEEHYPEAYQIATTTMDEAEEDFREERYEASFPKFRLVRDTILPLQPIRRPVEPRQEMVTTPVPPRGTPPTDDGDAAEEVLPRYYVVRRIPENRDAFNKIAGYDFVYGDRTRWRPLYEANKHLLQDPDNPDLIQPGMRFEIPSLDGETRSGVWQPPEE